MVVPLVAATEADWILYSPLQTLLFDGKRECVNISASVLSAEKTDGRQAAAAGLTVH